MSRAAATSPSVALSAAAPLPASALPDFERPPAVGAASPFELGQEVVGGGAPGRDLGARGLGLGSLRRSRLGGERRRRLRRLRRRGLGLERRRRLGDDRRLRVDLGGSGGLGPRRLRRSLPDLRGDVRSQLADRRAQLIGLLDQAPTAPCALSTCSLASPRAALDDSLGLAARLGLDLGRLLLGGLDDRRHSVRRPSRRAASSGRAPSRPRSAGGPGRPRGRSPCARSGSRRGRSRLGSRPAI